MTHAVSDSADLGSRSEWRDHVTVLEHGRADSNYYRDLWHFRELFVMFAWRDLSIRYKQSVFGAGWALIKPALTTIVFTFVFGRIARIASPGDAPYPIMVLAGTLPWFLFSTILTDSSASLVTAANMIQKVYFPRIMAPLAAACVSLADFLVSCVLLLAVMAYYRFLPDIRVLALPLFVLLALVASIGPALLMSALTVQYRDFRFVVPFIVQFGLYLSPVGFPSSIVPAQWRLLYNLNPMVAVIDGFRWSLLRGKVPLYWPGLALSCAVSLLFVLVAIKVFRGTEKTFADVI